jgi:[acyl-carrier-protein] S-malonyltransferase
MTETAFLFPGQGTDIMTSVSAFASCLPHFGELLERAARMAGTTTERIFGRGGRELSSTRLAQPTLIALCLALTEALSREGIQPRFAAGHSLGELAAWSALGALRAEDAVDVAAERASLMAREAGQHPGSMLALVNACERSVEDALALGRTRGSLVLAARNAPDEWVLSGDAPALTVVACAHRCVRLSTDGAWHSPAMAGAVPGVARALGAVRRSPLTGRLVLNRGGRVAEHEDALPDVFAEQLVLPVDWMAVLRTLWNLGVRRFVTVGPGKVLRGTLRKNFGAEVSVLSTDTPGELERTIGELKA